MLYIESKYKVALRYSGGHALCTTRNRQTQHTHLERTSTQSLMEPHNSLTLLESMLKAKGGKKTVGRTLKLKALAEERLEKETHSANNYLNAYPRACKGV